jgi:hypothetical protein
MGNAVKEKAGFFYALRLRHQVPDILLQFGDKPFPVLMPVRYLERILKNPFTDRKERGFLHTFQAVCYGFQYGERHSPVCAFKVSHC